MMNAWYWFYRDANFRFLLTQLRVKRLGQGDHHVFCCGVKMNDVHFRKDAVASHAEIWFTRTYN